MKVLIIIARRFALIANFTECERIIIEREMEGKKNFNELQKSKAIIDAMKIQTSMKKIHSTFN